ncbi:MAG: hypothetical protein HKN23_06990 [Verrucomicrobiales bacterium]|nr:hypothetical protein [Verrucomicrobiales bacterium]
MSEAAATTIPSEDPQAGKLADFSDKLSPMLVKELRQGMRTNLFTIAFILLQAFMVLCMLIGSAEQGDDTTRFFFWFFVITAMLVVQPIRGFGALSTEMTLNTMDLIQLTRLGAWRITFGKWAAIVAQSLLLITGILPYVVMRYFLGGVNLFQELLMIFYVILGSMLLTAMTVGFSSFKSVLLRVALLIGGGIGFSTLMGIVSAVYVTSAFTGMAPRSYFWESIGMVLAAAYATYYLLDLGASRIAPESANHSSRKRLISMAFILVMLCLPFFGVEQAFSFVTAGIVIALVGIDAITESPTVLPGVLRPFSRNAITRLAAGVLVPGWHTGLRFFLICVAVFVGALFIHVDRSNFFDMQNWLGTVAAVASITFPLLIIHLFFFPVTYSQFYFGLYILIQVCVLAVGWFIGGVAEIGSGLDPLLYMCFPIPFVCFLAASISNNDDPYFFIAALAFFVFSLVVPAVRSLPIFKRMRETFAAIDEGDDDSIVETSERQIIPKGAE